jgi:hypothetical protein
MAHVGCCVFLLSTTALSCIVDKIDYVIICRGFWQVVRTYVLWYKKKKGVNVGLPRHENVVSGSILCRHDRAVSAKSADIWLSGRRVADMSATLPAKLVHTDFVAHHNSITTTPCPASHHQMVGRPRISTIDWVA